MSRTYAFGPFRLEVAERRLLHDGRRVPLRAKVFDTLCALVERHGHLVTKEELFARLWPDAVVEENNLSLNVTVLRKALREAGAEEPFVETVSGKGYRFVAPVQLVDGDRRRASAPVGAESPAAWESASERTSTSGLAPTSAATSEATASTTSSAGAASVAAPVAVSVAMRGRSSSALSTLSTLSAPSAVPALPPLPTLIQRDAELDALRSALARARGGQRQLVCLSGEAGIGKTSLLNQFLREADAHGAHAEGPLIGRGQAVEYVGAGEAYMPMLDAISRMCHERGDLDLASALARYAPTWLVQLPALVADDAASARLRERTLGSTPDRMVREIAELLEQLSAHHLVVLALEDLQWSDPSTLSLITALARRQEPARLLIAVTHRTEETGGSGRSFAALAHDLELRGQCRMIRPGFLSEAALARLVGERLPGLAIDSDLITLVRDRTGGNPLFVEALIDYWRASGAVRHDADGWRVAGTLDVLRRGAPDTLRAMIQRTLEALSAEDEELLECASVIGTTFSSALLAAIAKRDVEAVEARCARLASGTLLCDEGIFTWPNASDTAQYGFNHALYQEVLYERVPPVRRARLHLAIARWIELAQGARAAERASELAHHFVAGRDRAAAVRFLRVAAENALGRSAHREAADYLRRALALIAGIEDMPDRHQMEFRLHAMLAPTALALEGFASPEAERSFARAREIGAAHGLEGELSPLLYGLAMMHELRGEYSTTEALLHERLALRDAGEHALVDSEPLMACSKFHQGRFAHALDHAENGARLYDPSRHLGLIAAWGENPGVACLGWAALSLWFLGFPDRAVDRITKAVALSEAPGHLFSLSDARTRGAHVHQLRRDTARTREWADAALRVSEAQGYLNNAGFAMVLQGWVGAKDGAIDAGLRRMTEGLAQLEAVGAQLDRPYLLALLTEILLEARQFDRVARTLEDAFALVRHSRAFFYEAELFRLKAALVAQTSGPQAREPRGRVESLLRQALAVSSAQGARALELRAATDLAELLLARGAVREARRLLQPIATAFDEGLGTTDLVRATTLLRGSVARA